jgi:hypothetical protein
MLLLVLSMGFSEEVLQTENCVQGIFEPRFYLPFFSFCACTNMFVFLKSYYMLLGMQQFRNYLPDYSS